MAEYTLTRQRDVGSYSYDLTLTIDEGSGVGGTLTVQTNADVPLAIAPPEGWMIIVEANDDGTAVFTFAGADDEDESRRIGLTSDAHGSIAHVRIPCLRAQRYAAELLTAGLTGDKVPRRDLKAIYNGNSPLQDYGDFLNDCRYMLEWEETVELMDLLSGNDGVFRNTIVETHDKWFANMLVKRTSKYQIRSRDVLDERLAVYNGYDNLLGLSIEDIEPLYHSKYESFDDPPTHPSDFGFTTP